jgi:four helix bundle protein
MKIERFEDINGWQMARELAREVYACTESGNFSRDFGLREQIRRAAGSVMHNIAEGFDSGSDIEFTRFLRYSQRSCTEVQSELYVAFDQKYLNEQQFNHLYELAKHTHSKIGGFIKYLKAPPSPSSITKTTKDQGPRTKDQ